MTNNEIAIWKSSLDAIHASLLRMQEQERKWKAIIAFERPPGKYGNVTVYARRKSVIRRHVRKACICVRVNKTNKHKKK